MAGSLGLQIGQLPHYGIIRQPLAVFPVIGLNLKNDFFPRPLGFEQPEAASRTTSSELPAFHSLHPGISHDYCIVIALQVAVQVLGEPGAGRRLVTTSL